MTALTADAAGAADARPPERQGTAASRARPRRHASVRHSGPPSGAARPTRSGSRHTPSFGPSPVAPTPTSSCRRCCATSGSTAETRPSPPSWSTGRCACAGSTTPSSRWPPAARSTSIDANVLDTLRLGAHQLLGMRVATHAAVDETVGLARKVNGAGASGFVNAVMRRVSERSLDEWLAEVAAGDRRPDRRGWPSSTRTPSGWSRRCARRCSGTAPRRPRRWTPTSRPCWRRTTRPPRCRWSHAPGWPASPSWSRRAPNPHGCHRWVRCCREVTRVGSPPSERAARPSRTRVPSSSRWLWPRCPWTGRTHSSGWTSAPGLAARRACSPRSRWRRAPT